MSVTLSQISRTSAVAAAASESAASASTTLGTDATSPLSPGLRKADARLRSQLGATTTQLSSFGQLKSSLSDTRSAAQALSGLAATSTAAEAMAAAQRFVTAFNATTASAKSAAALPEDAGTAGRGAARVGSDLRRAVAPNAAASDALRQIGIKQAADGSLTLDSAKFEAARKAGPDATRAALARLGQSADQAAAKGLATGAGLDDSLASLNQRATALKAQQSAVLSIQQRFAASTDAASGTSSGYIGYALAAYRSS